MKKVLVTGGTGFLGAYIIQELVNKGYAVRAIRRNSNIPSFLPDQVFQDVEWVQGDVLDISSLEEAMEGVDGVVHSAAIVSFNKKDSKQMAQVNIEGTANVVNTALDKHVKKMVHISSVAALGRTSNGGHVNEEKKWEESKVNTAYARSKHKAELEVWRGIGEGLEAVILNPSTILGFGDWNKGSCAIFKNIYNQFNYYTPGLNGFVDVEDTARLVVLFLENNISSERFVVNGDNWPFQKLQETIADRFGKKRPSKKAGPFLLSLAWRFEKVKSLFSKQRPLITAESVKVALSQTWFENDKLLRHLPGFSFTSLDKSIGKACEKYLSVLQ
jgi:dihydroflavonol-4-reductase